jgi:hypothetical protein
MGDTDKTVTDTEVLKAVGAAAGVDLTGMPRNDVQAVLYAVDHKGDVDAKLRKMGEDLDDCVEAMRAETVTFEKMMDYRLEDKTSAAILAHLFGTPKQPCENGKDNAGVAINRVLDLVFGQGGEKPAPPSS